jgi:hypothetical protein
MARNAEKALDWANAAKYYDLAADKYPHGRTAAPGSLTAKDVAALRQNAANARSMVRS